MITKNVVYVGFPNTRYEFQSFLFLIIIKGNHLQSEFVSQHVNKYIYIINQNYVRVLIHDNSKLSSGFPCPVIFKTEITK
jgi:hypothetical protein